MKESNIDTILGAASIMGATAATWMINNALGLIVGIGGLVVQVYFNHRRDKREERILKIQEKENEKNLE